LFVVPDVLVGNKRLFEEAVNLAQFPEDQNKENRDHEQQELDIHLKLFGSREFLTLRHSTTRFALKR
jgi:hypothetical protein